MLRTGGTMQAEISVRRSEPRTWRKEVRAALGCTRRSLMPHCVPSNLDAAHFREAHFGGLHASRHHAQDSMENLRAQRRIALAAGSQGSPFHLQGGGVFARPHLEQGVLIVEQGTPSEDVPRPQCL